MEVAELKEALAAVNSSRSITVSIPSLDRPAETRHLHWVGHVHHKPGVRHDDTAVHALDLVCDNWDNPQHGNAVFGTVKDFLEDLQDSPDEMHVRIAVPLDHETNAYRMLDITTVGYVVGSGKSGSVQLVTENWDNPMQVIVSKAALGGGEQSG